MFMLDVERDSIVFDEDDELDEDEGDVDDDEDEMELAEDIEVDNESKLLS